MSGIEKLISTSNKNYYLKSSITTKHELRNGSAVSNTTVFPAKDSKSGDKLNRILLYLAGIGTIAAAGVYFVKRRGAVKKAPILGKDNTPAHELPATNNSGNTSVVSHTEDSSVNKFSDYITGLAESLSVYMGEKISPERIASVMDRTEFMEAVSNLKRENYVLNKENMEKWIFKADLHSHSNYSDGKGTVEDIMTQVAEYADRLFAKTGEKFIYALTDHDSANGSKEALKIIALNPEKYKNVRFVVGSEVSYLIKTYGKTSNVYETTELLLYGFNPFSAKVEAFFNDVLNRRLGARKEYIKDLSEKFPDIKFSEDEFLNVFLGDKVSHNPILNSYWQLYHYGQVKKELSANAVYKNLNPEEYFRECMKNAPEKLYFSEFRKKNIIENWVEENSDINAINEKYKPHETNGKLDKTSENTIDDIIAAFKGEKDCVAGFAHPYYMCERTDDVDGLVNYVKSKLADMLKLTETYHQAYSSELLRDKAGDITRISDMCESKGLIPIGGRDNHTADFMWSSYLN